MRNTYYENFVAALSSVKPVVPLRECTLDEAMSLGHSWRNRLGHFLAAAGVTTDVYVSVDGLVDIAIIWSNGQERCGTTLSFPSPGGLINWKYARKFPLLGFHVVGMEAQLSEWRTQSRANSGVILFSGERFDLPFATCTSVMKRPIYSVAPDTRCPRCGFEPDECDHSMRGRHHVTAERFYV